jgi:hypothetical protein
MHSQILAPEKRAVSTATSVGCLYYRIDRGGLDDGLLRRHNSLNRGWVARAGVIKMGRTGLCRTCVRYRVTAVDRSLTTVAAVLVTRHGGSLGSMATISIAWVAGRHLDQITGDVLLGCVSRYPVFSMAGVTASDDGDFLGWATFTYQP